MPDGSAFAGGLHADVNSALAEALPVQGDRCGLTFLRCRRLGLDAADPDGYEPNDPALRSAGLPTDFFTSIR